MHGKDGTTGTDRIETRRRNFGRLYRTDDNDAYVDRDFATRTSGASSESPTGGPTTSRGPAPR